jgi:hypothetical protein
MRVQLHGRAVSRSAGYQEGGTCQSFFAVVRVTMPTKVAALPYLDLVGSNQNGGSRD